MPAQCDSTIKFNTKAKKSARRLAKKVGSNGSADAGALFAAAEFVVNAGGVEQAQAAVAKVAAMIG